MFKLPNLPSPRAEVHELADFAEILAWRFNETSSRAILAYLNRINDNYYNEGCDDEGDEDADELDEVMIEIDRRRLACGNGYPFYLDMQGTVIKYTADDNSHRADVYRYLLLSTRLNMKDHRIHGEIDGTHLLEEISAAVLKFYLGATRAKSFVFGTAATGTFPDKVNHLCREIGEGGFFKNIDESSVDAVDDKLDAVAWVPFVDNKPGKLIIFAQCKTGSTWESQITQLQPDSFLKRWTTDRCFVLNPLRAFCISETARLNRWKGTILYAGLLFDRCRIVDFCEELTPDLLGRVRIWNDAAMRAVAIG